MSFPFERLKRKEISQKVAAYALVDRDDSILINTSKCVYPTQAENKEVLFLRDRKEFKGELVQIDGSIHRWFGDEKTLLLTAIDDATGELYARFLPENTEGMMIFLRSYIEQKGSQIKVLNINRRTPKPKTLNFEGKALYAGNFATLLRKQMKSQLRQ